MNFESPGGIFAFFVLAVILWWFVGMSLCTGFCDNTYTWQKPYQAALFLPALLVVFRLIGKYKTPMQRYGIAPIGPWKRYLLFGTLVGAGIFVFQYLLRPDDYIWASVLMLRSWFNWWTLLYLLIFMLNAIVLEFLFRGLILSLWAKQKNVWVGMVASSIMFAMTMTIWMMGLSFSWLQAFVWFSFGMLAGILAWLTRSLWTSVGLHLTFYTLFFASAFVGLSDRFYHSYTLPPWLIFPMLALTALIYWRPRRFIRLVNKMLFIQPEEPPTEP